MNILDFFPGEPRSGQKALLLQLEKDWDTADVFVLQAPVAFGKSRVAVCIASWLEAKTPGGRCRIVTPTNILVKQYQSDFPKVPTLYAKKQYGSNYASAREGFLKAPVSVCNYYTHMSAKHFPSTLIVDEAHGVFNLLQEANSLKLWKHDLDLGRDIYTREDLISALQTELETIADKALAKRVKKALKALLATKTTHVFSFTKELFKGKYEHCFKLVPLMLNGTAPILWPYGKTRKLVFMSATFNDIDLTALGITDRRVRVYECPSSIPASNRPVVADFLGKMSVNTYSNPRDLAAIEAKIQALAERHNAGVVHVPYALLGRLTGLRKHPRFLFADRGNAKNEAYTKFVADAGKSKFVLVAAGLYEGVDLLGDIADFQILVKIPFASLGDSAIQTLAHNFPERYAWETIRQVIQCVGRVCRGPKDFGVTYILDEAFDRLFSQHRALFPDFFAASVIRPRAPRAA